VNPIRVVVVDDDPYVRRQIVAQLAAAGDIRVVAEAADGDAAVVVARTHAPDVVLMDVRMDGRSGIAATRELSADDIETPDRVVRVLLHTAYQDELTVEALKVGASGFLLKQSPDDLVPAIRYVAAGDGWIDPAVAGRVLGSLRAGITRGPQAKRELFDRLTTAEREVLALMADGQTNSEIARVRVVSVATVRTQVTRILTKTGSRSRTEAVVLAFRSGLVTP
jgi:DNA-binding NarL/FixJ family response regulator